MQFGSCAKLVVLAVCILAAGCGTNPLYIDTSAYQDIERENVVSKNYELGVATKAYVGNPIVRYRDYWVTKKTVGTQYWAPNADFEMTARSEKIVGKQGQRFQEVGRTNFEGETYHVIYGGKSPLFFAPQVNYGVLLDENGVPLNKVLNNSVIMVFDFEIIPSNLQFTKLPTEMNEAVDSEAGYNNYELIYGGNAGGVLRVQYREYSPENLAREAFFQELTYSAETDTIRFKDLQIVVHEANNEHIRYTVVSD